MGSMEFASHGCATTLSEICSTQIMFKQCNSTILLRVRATQSKDATLPTLMVNNPYKCNPITLELSTTNKIDCWFNHSGWLNMKGVAMDDITFCGVPQQPKDFLPQGKNPHYLYCQTLCCTSRYDKGTNRPRITTDLKIIYRFFCDWAA